MTRARLDTAAVVQAAAKLADAEGLEALTLARLAAVLGVRSPSLYAHVDSLEDLRRRLGARGARELAAELGRAAAGRAGSDALGTVAHAYLSYAREHPGSYAAAQRARELQGDDEAVAAATAVADVVLAVLRGYDLHDADAIHAARVIRVALHGFVSLEADAGFAIELSLDESFERLVAMLDRGLRA
ncbi:MAG TPA: WHG domain-containing protein [Solirubrobacteraceae bacterium]|jgi:AcrR family transcriptional regulator|nr:WHG domain-containing protein [Solirubrobacteraceae bacterium]